MLGLVGASDALLTYLMHNEQPPLATGYAWHR